MIQSNLTESAHSKRTPAPRLDSAAVVWAVAAGALILGAFCLVSLTWDGSYILFRTLQEGSPFIANRRWFDWVLLAPVLWARPVVGTPAGLAVVHGLMCAGVPLLSLAACLRLLKGAWARLRVWVVLGILLLPLPGQLPLVGEVTLALQCSWVLFAFTWRGCPPRWTVAALCVVGAMATLHPVAAPLFFLAAITAALLGLQGDARERVRLQGWAVFFAAAAAAKFAEVLLLATPYERANMDGAVWVDELLTALRYTPFAALLPVLADVALGVWHSLGRNAATRPAWMLLVSRTLWATAFALGLYYSLDWGGWCGSLNFRKFGIVLTAPFVLLAALDAWRLRQNNGPQKPQLAGGHIRLIFPAFLFAVVFSGMACSWHSLCDRLSIRMKAQPDAVVTMRDLRERERDSALNHWSTTSLSLILQGWEPGKVFLWEPPLQLADQHFRICPVDDDLTCEDKGFRIRWIQEIAPGAVR